MSIIAICGFKRSGKDTIADGIVKNGMFVKKQIASTLKHVCQLIFQLSNDQVDGNSKDIIENRYGKTPREILQFFGTEMMQFKLAELLPNSGRRIWIDRLLSDIQHNQHVVISDLRFMHEFQAIKEKYGSKAIVIRVINPNIFNSSSHSSETEWMQIPPDYTIHNDSTIEELNKKIQDVYTEILARIS